MVFGGAGFAAGGSQNLAAVGSDGGFTITGANGFDYAGWSVSSAGDFNGDGYDDLVIGAKSEGISPNFNGYAYVVFGGAGLTSGSNINLGAIDGVIGIHLNGVADGDYAGYSVSAAGDVNGDGFDDVIVGALNADPLTANEGEAYVIFGGNFSGGILFQGTTAAEPPPAPLPVRS